MDQQQIKLDELLSTKLAPPRLQASWVAREALLARLEAGLEGKLTLLSAPPGFGKTTLVSQWLYNLQVAVDDLRLEIAGRSPIVNRQSEIVNRRVAWVTLDSGDDDPVRFWRYVITACQPFGEGIGESSLALLRNSPQPSFETILTRFINELAQLPERGILALEDYHVISSRQIHDLVTFLLDHLPETLRLVITTRSDPPLPLARLRVRNQLVELGAADLRFSMEETQAFMRQALPFPLPPEAITRLANRTEGWVAGLRLVSLALRGRQEPAAVEQFLVTFSGSHGHILEYLVEEVLGSQPEPLQLFLLETAFLSRLTGPLCDAVTGRQDSATLLEQFERANLFLSPLDSVQQWYRYHTLFAEAMQHYARQRLGEARLHELSRRAGLWYEAQGMLPEAVEAALAAQDFEQTASLIKQMIAPQLHNNEYVTLKRWLKQLPEAVLYSYPALCFIYAVATLFTSDRRAPTTWDVMRGPLEAAEKAWQAEGDRLKLGGVLTIRALIHWLHGEVPPSFAAARQALELLPEDDIQWRGINLIFVGAEAFMAGDLKTARPTIQQARALCETVRNSYGALDSIVLLGRIYAGQGELRQAAQFYRQALAELEQAPMDRDQALMRRGRALASLSEIELEWNDLDAAQQAATQALQLSQRYAEEDTVVRSSLVLAQILQAQGETAQAQERLQTLMTQIKQPLLLREVRAGQAQLACAAGDLATVQRWASSLDGLAVPFPQQEGEALLNVRWLIAQGEGEAALCALEARQVQAHNQGRTGHELQILVLKALTYATQEQLPQAKQTLLEALALAQPEGYQRLFLNEGKPMAELLQAVLPEADALRAYIDDLRFTIYDLRLLADQSMPLVTEKSESVKLPEPLSPQEERVLRLLAAGLSNPEIAEALIVSVNTIKTQVKSIYGKLAVHSREEAGEVARRLKLV